MSDFIREVDEEYRRDRTIALLSRYQVPIAIAVVAIVVGAGGWRYWQDRQVSEAEAVNTRYVAAADLAAAGKTDEAKAAFAALAKSGPTGYALLARVRGAEIEAPRDPEAAAKAFDAIAVDDSLPGSMRDTARLRGAMLRLDREDPKAFENRYGIYGREGAGFHNAFRELLALAALKRQDYDTAGRYLDEIIIDPQAPQGLRGRAQALRQLVLAGPVTKTDTQPPPAKVEPVGQGAKPDAKPAPAPAETKPADTKPAEKPATPPPAGESKKQ